MNTRTFNLEMYLHKWKCSRHGIGRPQLNTRKGTWQIRDGLLAEEGKGELNVFAFCWIEIKSEVQFGFRFSNAIYNNSLTNSKWAYIML